MNNYKGTHYGQITLPGVKTERHLRAIETLEELEDIQCINDDVFDLFASCNKTIERTIDRLIKQNDAIDYVIERISKGGVFYG